MKTALIISFILFGQTYNIELAVTPMEQATGLMYRKEWKSESQGMLFIYQEPKQVSFWMKNTHLNLSMFYLDKNMNILELYHPTPLSETGVVSKSKQVQYILELNPSLEKEVISNWKEFKKKLADQLVEYQPKIKQLEE